MQSSSPDAVKLLPPHILRYDPPNICYIIKQTVDTCSVENHELLDAEARTLQYKKGKTSKTTSQNKGNFETACKYQATPTLTLNTRQSDTWSKASPTTPTCTPSQSYSRATPHHDTVIHQPPATSAADPRPSTQQPNRDHSKATDTTRTTSSQTQSTTHPQTKDYEPPLRKTGRIRGEMVLPPRPHITQHCHLLHPYKIHHTSHRASEASDRERRTGASRTRHQRSTNTPLIP